MNNRRIKEKYSPSKEAKFLRIPRQLEKNEQIHFVNVLYELQVFLIFKHVIDHSLGNTLN